MTHTRIEVPLPPPWTWAIPFILAVLGWGAFSFIGYTANDKDLTGRVVAIETQVKADSINENARLDRIESKVDRMEATVNELFYQMTGRKR